MEKVLVYFGLVDLLLLFFSLKYLVFFVFFSFHSLVQLPSVTSLIHHGLLQLHALGCSVSFALSHLLFEVRGTFNYSIFATATTLKSKNQLTSTGFVIALQLEATWTAAFVANHQISTVVTAAAIPYLALINTCTSKSPDQYG